MNRRSKLSKEERQKRAVKREQRAEEAPARRAARQVREAYRRLPRAVRLRYRQIGMMYEWATRNPIVSQVVCEKCGLAQPYITDEDSFAGGGSAPTSYTGVTLCLSQHLLEIPCDGEYAVTMEAFSGS